MPIGSPQWMYASGEDFTIDQSLRFDDGSSAYLNRTPSSASNRRTWTFSAWMKMGTLVGSGSTSMFTAYWGNDDNGYLQFGFDSSDRLGVWGYDTTWRVSTQVFRDTSAWYHIVLAVDTTNDTAQNRIRVYINGSEITVWTTNNTVTEDLDTAVNYNGAHYLGSLSTTQAFHDGYLSEVHLIDGTQLTPSSFGETGDYGEWKPIEVSGLTYGTNGFYLSFAGGGVISSATGGTITTDGDYKVHSFTADGTFTPSAAGYVEYLVVGGGAGGMNGGGGAGGFRTGVLEVAAQGYSITVGDGGATGANNGEDSVFSSITAVGGGRPSNVGGSGGGGEGGSSGGAGTAGQGNAGGTGGSASTGFGAGGGGAGEAGENGADGGTGGDGKISNITGSSVYYAGGGGGGAASSIRASAAGGQGGGGTGKDYTDASSNGTPNTGGGGGGNYNGGAYRNGGSGIVIIRYKFQ